MTNDISLGFRPIFPTVLGMTHLGRKFTHKEISFIRDLEMTRNHSNSVSVDHNVLDREEMVDIKSFCDRSINKYLKDIYNPINDLKLRITQSWINVTEKNERHHRHHHSNSVFSASFYISTNEEDKIYFYRPSNSIFVLDANGYNELNASSWWVPAEEGSMVMFPSWLEHEVRSKETDGKRISLSFNTFYVGSLGVDDTLTRLDLN